MIQIPPRYRFKPKEGGRPILIRRIHCGQCNHVLAEEVGDLHKTAIEWFSITREGLWIKGKWWGNSYICPYCGKKGNLPMDKPLTEGCYGNQD